MNDLKKIEEIYHAALEKTPDEREEFLKKSCGDDEELRREVESLLEFDVKAKDFIESPPEDFAADIFSKKTDETNLVGRILNNYRVLSRIGAGGMGEVFLAEDTKLGRRVALKILPSQFSENPERKQRFEREARAVSALNHPNIITIYSIEELGGTNFIATEFVEGETLRERIAKGSLTVDETLEIGVQIAGALEAAHAEKIVHRDIKPANIMIRRDGLVKVLDFGLAKLTSAESGEINLEAETREHFKTKTGVIMGTVNYMSPEQALGEKIDERTDIFSFGAVLYEMLKGKPPFEGASDAAVYNEIINKNPPSLGESNGEIPSVLCEIINRTLIKNKDERYQTAKDLKNDLQMLRQVSTTSGEAFSASFAPTKSKSARWLFLLLIPLVLAAVYFGFFYGHSAVNPFQTVKFDRLTAHSLTITAAISPDGKFVVYAKDEGGKQSLWLRQTNIAGDTQIAPPSQIKYRFLTLAPDGDSIYFVAVEGENTAPSLFQISTIGRNQRKLIDGVNSQISFAPDGKSLAFVRDTGTEDNLIIADINGGNERVLATRKNPDVYTQGVSWSPDGKLIAVATLRRNTRYAGGMAVVDVATGAEKPIALSEKEVIMISHVAWAKDGKGLIFCRYVSPTGERYQLQYATFPSGKIQNITNDLTSYEDLSLTADGKILVSTQREYSMGIWLTEEGDFTKAAKVQTNTGRDDGERGIAWTADGKIVYVSSESEAQNIWRVDADGTNQKPLTSGNQFGKVYPMLAADTGLITYLSDREKGLFVWQMDSEGQNVRQVNNDGNAYFPASANKDWVVYTSHQGGKNRIFKTSANSGGEPIKLTETESFFPVISPNGKQVAYIEQEKGQPQKISIISIDGGNPLKSFELPVTTKTDAGIAWNKEGNAVFFINTLGTISNIWQQTLDGKPPKPVTDFKEFQITAFALNPQGTRFAVSRGSRNRDAVLLRNVQ